MPRLTLTDLRDCRKLLPGTGFKLPVPCTVDTPEGPQAAFQVTARKPGTTKDGGNHPTTVTLVLADSEGKPSTAILRDYSTSHPADVRDYYRQAVKNVIEGGPAAEVEPGDDGDDTDESAD